MASNFDPRKGPDSTHPVRSQTASERGMLNLEEAMKQSSKGYAWPLHVRVIGKATQGASIRYAVADEKAAAECIVYDGSKEKLMATDASIMIINCNIKHNQLKKFIEITENSRVSKSGRVSVPDDIRKQAEMIVQYKAAEFIKVDSVATSPAKKMVSVRGQVVSEEMTETVKSKGHDIDLKNISIKERGATCRVALWRECSASEIGIGDYIEVTDVVTNKYKEEVYVSSTRGSIVKKVDQPIEREKVTIISFEVIDKETVQLTSEGCGFPTYDVKKALLMTSFEGDDEDDIEEILTSNVPFCCEIVSSKDGVVSFSQ